MEGVCRAFTFKLKNDEAAVVTYRKVNRVQTITGRCSTYLQQKDSILGVLQEPRSDPVLA
jgi:hypothetical protein